MMSYKLPCNFSQTSELTIEVLDDTESDYISIYSSKFG